MSSQLVDVRLDVDRHTHVATVTLDRPPNNFFDVAMVRSIADACERAVQAEACNAIVLAAAGKHFCAGRDNTGARSQVDSTEELYAQAHRLFDVPVPVVAAVQGAAVGGGLGLALAADLRVGRPSTRLWANFSLLGFHHGFGLTVTLPRVVGQQRATEMLCTGERIDGRRAADIGLLDRLVDDDEDIVGAARELAVALTAGAPLAVRAIRATLRGDLAAKVRAATAHELAEQERLRRTHDYREGVAAMAERRPPRFEGR